MENFLSLGYLQFSIWLGFFSDPPSLPPLCDSPQDSSFSSWLFCCSFQHASLWGLFSQLFCLCLISCLPLAWYTCSKLRAILLQCSPWNSVGDIFIEIKLFLSYISLVRWIHTLHKIQPLIKDSFLWNHMGKETFLTAQVFGTSLICSFCLRTPWIGLSCSDTISKNDVPFICFVFSLIKIF